MAPSSSPSMERKRRTEACNCPSPPLSPSEELKFASSDLEGTKVTRRTRLARLVSRDNIMGNPMDSLGPTSPVSKRNRDPSPPLNPLMDSRMRQCHMTALRLEAELYPMRLILTRLMGHQTHNRKGLFNYPVDAQALGLFDYHQIIQKPMDLGTVKRRLHAVAYPSRQEASDDIRLVFMNAMRYNPPKNPIHEAAKELLIYFEQALMNVDNGEQMDCTEILVPSAPIPSISQTTSVSNDVTAKSPLSTGENFRALQAEGETEYGLHATSSLCIMQDSSWVASASKQEPLIISKKASRLPPFVPHSCGACQSRKCGICQQGCLLHEPALMVCQGIHCGGARLRKGNAYFVTADGHQHYCERCHTNLQAVLPGYSENDPCRYKKDLLKRMNHEEIAEPWVECSSCSAGVHAVCAMHNGLVHDDSTYVCPNCQETSIPENITLSPDGSADGPYTFVSGSDLPVSMSSFGNCKGITADSLPECSISAFIQSKIANRLKNSIPNADRTATVRVISDSSRHFVVPDVVQRHFCMATAGLSDVVSPPSLVRYRQKAIALFQKIDGLDVCIFCMYVQEYDGHDDYEPSIDPQEVRSSHAKRVYIAYIDSVEHFRPREVRTDVYHEILVAYLATARARGYEAAHIWACPPSRGNSFVFWNHPASQRTPNQERLLQWYHGALSKAIHVGVVTDVKSLYESEFETFLSDLDVSKGGRMICPPLLDGDFWIDEAVRIHSAAKARHTKVRAPTEVCVWNVTPLLSSELDPCPALQIAALVKDRIMTHPASVPFRRPVNAAALNLHNYHDIVSKPMDLGTIYAQCVIGEYHHMADVVQDIELMVSNAKCFNPVTHYVHTKADEVLTLFYQELMALIQIWDASTGAKEQSTSWQAYATMSMSLDHRMVIASRVSSSVFIEDDRSTDGTRSVNSVSVLSFPSSPMANSKDDDEEDKKAPAVEKRRRRRCQNTGSRRRTLDRETSQDPKACEPPKPLDLLVDGPQAVLQSMVGQDYWLLEKRLPPAVGTKRRRILSCASGGEVSSVQESCNKIRRQAWVGEEVSEAVRRIRTSFFTCSLMPRASLSEAERTKLSLFEAYASQFDHGKPMNLSLSSPISEARHALLEFSQYRKFEFDTLRRAKYSTSMLLYYLQNGNAPGVIPACSSCNETIEEVRWHKVKKAAEKRRVTKFMKPVPPEPLFIQEELCGCCHANRPEKEEFIPIPVSLKP